MRITRRSALLAALAAPAAGCAPSDRRPGPAAPRPPIECDSLYPDLSAADMEPPDPSRVIGTQSVCLSGDGSELAAIHGVHVIVWSTADGRIVRSSGADQRPSFNSGALAWDPTRDVLARSVCAAQVELLDARTFASLGMLTGHEEIEAIPVSQGITAISHSADGALVATGAADDTVRIWGAEDRVERRVLSLGDTGVSGGHMRFSPDSRRLVVSGGQEQAIVYDAQSGKVRAELTGVAEQAGPSWSPDGSHLLLGRTDGTLQLVDGDSLRGGQTPQLPLALYSPVWSADGSHVLARTADDAQIAVWEVGSSDVVTLPVPPGEKARLYASTVDPDRFFVAAEKSGITAWDLARGEMTLRFELPAWGG